MDIKGDIHIEYGELTPVQLIDLINIKFEWAKKARISRMSVEWGKWSREMNVTIRARIDAGNDPFEIRLKYVFIYWTLVSQLLEMHYSKKLFGQSKKKKLMKEAKAIRELAKAESEPVDTEFTNESIVKSIFK